MMILLSGVVSGQSDTLNFSLDQAINFAFENQLNIKNAYLDIADAEAQIIERRAAGLPSVSGNVSFQHYIDVPVQPLPQPLIDFFSQLNPGQEVSGEASFFLKNNFNASLNLETMIFEGSYFVGLQAAKAYRKYVQEDLLVKRRETKTQVTNAFLPLMLLDANISIIDKNIANLEQLLFETRELYKAGFVEQLDIDRQTLSLTNLKTERENLLRQKANASNALKMAMGYPIGKPIEISGQLENMDTEVAEAALVKPVEANNRPEVGLINVGMELNEINHKFYRSQYLPALRGNAAYVYAYQGNDFSTGFWAPQFFVGASLRIPIFDGFDKKAKIQRATIEIEKTTNQKGDLLRAINLEVKSARNNYLNATRTLTIQQENQALAERIYNTTQIKYREGVGSSLEVTQAEQGLYTAQRNYLQALYDVIKAKMDLQIAMGQ